MNLYPLSHNPSKPPSLSDSYQRGDLVETETKMGLKTTIKICLDGMYPAETPGGTAVFKSAVGIVEQNTKKHETGRRNKNQLFSVVLTSTA